MTSNRYHMSDDAFASFGKKYSDVKRSDIEDVFAQEFLAEMALHARESEIEFLKNKALGAMGISREMNFSDIESGMPGSVFRTIVRH